MLLVVTSVSKRADNSYAATLTSGGAYIPSLYIFGIDSGDNQYLYSVASTSVVMCVSSDHQVVWSLQVGKIWQCLYDPAGYLYILTTTTGATSVNNSGVAGFTVYKLNLNGALLWARAYGAKTIGLTSAGQFSSFMCLDPAGNLVCAFPLLIGVYTTYLMILRVSATDGSITSQFQLAGNHCTTAVACDQNGIYLCTYLPSNGNPGRQISMFDLAGNPKWKRSVLGTQFVNSFILPTGSGLWLAYGTSTGTIVTQYDLSGNLLSGYGSGPSTGAIRPMSFVQTPVGFSLSVAVKSSSPTSNRVGVLSLDTGGAYIDGFSGFSNYKGATSNDGLFPGGMVIDSKGNFRIPALQSWSSGSANASLLFKVHPMPYLAVDVKDVNTGLGFAGGSPFTWSGPSVSDGLTLAVLPVQAVQTSILFTDATTTPSTVSVAVPVVTNLV